VANFCDLRDLLGGLGVCYGHRQLVDVDGRPLGIPVAVEVLVVGANGIFPESKSQFTNGLGNRSVENTVHGSLRAFFMPVLVA